MRRVMGVGNFLVVLSQAISATIPRLSRPNLTFRPNIGYVSAHLGVILVLSQADAILYAWPLCGGPEEEAPFKDATIRIQGGRQHKPVHRIHRWFGTPRTFLTTNGQFKFIFSIEEEGLVSVTLKMGKGAL